MDPHSHRNPGRDHVPAITDRVSIDKDLERGLRSRSRACEPNRDCWSIVRCSCHYPPHVDNSIGERILPEDWGSAPHGAGGSGGTESHACVAASRYFCFKAAWYAAVL